MKQTLSLIDRISLAKGERPADLLITGGKLVNVLSGEIVETDIAVAGDTVIGFGEYEAAQTIDAAGKFISPALIEGHIHIESTMLSPPHFANVVASHGTCAVICDPHEIANVLGLDGIEYMLEASDNLPVSIFVMMPSCVPATHLENSGAYLSAEDISNCMSKHPQRILGLAELMNFPGVLFRDPQVLAKIEAADGMTIDGHAPMVSGKDLSAYIISGPSSDHESTGLEEAREKLRKGMHLMIREGTTEHNLKTLLPVINDYNNCRISLVSDDRHPDDLIEKGHLDYSVKLAVENGVNPLRAIQMASINTAKFYGLKNRGAIAPGYRADFVILDNLEEFKISSVFLGGRNVKSYDFKPKTKVTPKNSMHIASLNAETFKIVAKGKKAAAIGITPGQIVTTREEIAPVISGEYAEVDPQNDVAKLAVIERHKALGNTGLAFVKGLGIKKGAIAGTVAHDSHNLIVAGMNDADMLKAAQEAVEIGGGFVVVDGGEVKASLALPIAGLMSAHPVEEIVSQLKELNRAAEALGGGLKDPFMMLSFLALPVIPRLKLTDKGLVDVNKFDFIDMWGE